MLASVDSLSDEETCNVKVPSAVPRIPRPRPPRFKRRLGRFSQKDSADLKKLRWIVSSKCGCSGKCYQPFNETPHLFNEWAKLRRTFQNMTKLEKDEHATQLRFKVFLISNMLFLIRVWSCSPYMPFPFQAPGCSGFSPSQRPEPQRCLQRFEAFEASWATTLPSGIPANDGNRKTKVSYPQHSSP